MHQKSAIISDSLFRGKALVSRWTYGVVLWVGVFRVLTITITTWVLKPFSVVSTHKYSNHNSTEILTTQITTRKYSQLRVVSSCWWKYSARKDSRLSVFRLFCFQKFRKKSSSVFGLQVSVVFGVSAAFYSEKRFPGWNYGQKSREIGEIWVTFRFPDTHYSHSLLNFYSVEYSLLKSQLNRSCEYSQILKSQLKWGTRNTPNYGCSFLVPCSVLLVLFQYYFSIVSWSHVEILLRLRLSGDTAMLEQGRMLDMTILKLIHTPSSSLRSISTPLRGVAAWWH